jgi:hypothetical protein
MRKLIKAYEYLNVLSIDVSAGAVVCAFFFVRVMQLDVRTVAFIALGLTVWIIYTTDHLSDARKLTSTASTMRHQFHQHYFRRIRLLLVVALLADLVFVMMIREPLFLAGLILGMFILLYLLTQRFLKVFKEFWGGILYTTGVTLPMLTFGYQQLSIPVILLIIQFLVTTWINLLLFSLFDKEKDEQDGRVSFATTMGPTATKKTVVLLLTFCFGLGFYLITFHKFFAAGIILFMDAALAAIFALRNRATKEEEFRLVGDAVFLLPLLYLL